MTEERRGWRGMTEREEASLESCIIDNDGDVSLTRALFDTLCVCVCVCVCDRGWGVLGVSCRLLPIAARDATAACWVRRSGSPPSHYLKDCVFFLSSSSLDWLHLVSLHLQVSPAVAPPPPSSSCVWVNGTPRLSRDPCGFPASRAVIFAVLGFGMLA